jgi:hypothetical protein
VTLDEKVRQFSSSATEILRDGVSDQSGVAGRFLEGFWGPERDEIEKIAVQSAMCCATKFKNVQFRGRCGDDSEHAQ